MTEDQGFQMPTAGAKHELLKPFEGTFVSKVKMWMGPGDPMESSGKIINTFQLGGLFLNQEYKGDRTDGPFPSFEGYGYWGFDESSQKYQGYWIDNAATTMQIETGDVDESGKIWEMKSEFVMPGAGIMMKKRTLFTVVSNDHHTMESFITPPDSEEVVSMFIDYHRA